MSNFVRRIIVLNTKGGCGKTTIATNVASLYACAGYKTALIDQDPQGSSLQWLRCRPSGHAAVKGVAMHEASRMPLSGAWQLRIPRETERVVVDTPAGVRGLDLAGRITAQDWLLIPVLPSAMDIRATGDFIRDVLMTARLRPQDQRLAFIGNRTRRSSQAFEKLKSFLASTKVPVLAHLRESQHYAVAAERGEGICELSVVQARRDRTHWKSVMDWLEADGRGKPVSIPTVAVERKPREPAAPVPSFLTQGWEGEANAEASPPIPPKDLH